MKGNIEEDESSPHVHQHRKMMDDHLSFTDYQKNGTPTIVKLEWLFLPSLLHLVLLTLYLFCSAFIFSLLDDSLVAVPLEELILFEITTLATIGYGNVAPRTPAARIFCVVFSVFGIPLFLLAVANIGKNVAKLYWHTVSCITGKKEKGAMRGGIGLPLFVSLLLFLALVVSGGRVMAHTGERRFTDDVYFSFISFSTVGFGDIVPVCNSPSQFIIILLYLLVGIALISALFTSFSAILRKVHYFGRRFRGARDVRVWMGGRAMPVSQMLEIVGKEFHASPREVRYVLRDLDCLLLSVIERDKKERREKNLVSNGQDIDRNGHNARSYLASQEDFDVT